MLTAVACACRRFSRPEVIVIGMGLALLADAPIAAGQTPASPAQPPAPQVLTTRLTADILADLPLGNNVYTALETVQPELISDRFNSAGLNVGGDVRIGGFLASPSQTTFRIGDLDISDPSGSGSALQFPELLFWERAEILNGLMPVDINTPGLGVVLEPRRPTAEWTTMVEASGSGGGLIAEAPVGLPPPVVRLAGAASAAFLVSGPIRERLGLVIGASSAESSRFTLEVNPARKLHLASGFLHLTYAPSLTSEWRLLGLIQRTEVPFANRLLTGDQTTTDHSTHMQTTWSKKMPSGMEWRIVGGVTRRERANDIGSPSTLTADRLLDGPIPLIVDGTADRTTTRWSVGARATERFDRGSTRHFGMAGLDVDGSHVTTSGSFAGTINELVDNAPARNWAFAPMPAESQRHSTNVALFASDRMEVSPFLTVDAGFRVDVSRGNAEGAANGVTWWNILPQASFRWEFNEIKKLAFIGGYRRAANRMNLDLLAYGDPNASTALVSRAPATTGVGTPVIIDRVGPGTGGDPTFSGIDPELGRPVTDEWVVGIESRAKDWLQYNLIGVARREASLIAVVDTGVTAASYSTFTIPDPGLDFVDAVDDQEIPVYNRLPASFGRNRYVLTNPEQDAATGFALMFTAKSQFAGLMSVFGATASIARGVAGNRGFRTTENDQDQIGEAFTNPNAATFASGRLFTDRAFTIKWTTTYRFPWDFHAGVIARYQDGQPFARYVLAPNLAQGAEVVRAYPNASNRFTFTGTLDIRLQKGFRAGPVKADAILDFYNLVTRSNEVEEYVMTGDRFRTPTVIEPPHSIHVGVRLTF